VRWRGRAGCNYQQLLGPLSAELGALRASYDGACDVLLGYARVLEQAKALAHEADLLGARADSANFGDFSAPRAWWGRSIRIRCRYGPTP